MRSVDECFKELIQIHSPVHLKSRQKSNEEEDLVDSYYICWFLTSKIVKVGLHRVYESCALGISLFRAC